MRIRTIKPEFWLHEGLAGCAEFTRLLAIALLNWADDEGYFMAHPALLRGGLFPFEEDSSKIQRGIEELSRVGWIQTGEDKTGRQVGKVINFSKHQKVDRPKSSVIKALCKIDETSPKTRRPIVDQSSEEGKGMEGNGSIGAASATQETSTKISDEDSEPPETPPPAPRPRDECFEALAEIQGSSLSSLTKSERGRLNKALCDIRAACPGLTPQQLRRRADAYREAMPKAMLTATALAAWWSRLTGSEPAAETEKKFRGAARLFDAAEVGAPPAEWEDAFELLYDMPPDGEWHHQQPYVREAIINHLEAAAV